MTDFSNTLYPIQKPRIPHLEAVLPYLKQMESSGKFSNFGPLERSLRSRFAEYFKVDESQIATCANATLAISGATEILPPNKWFVPMFTFPATIHAVLHAGGEVQLIDVTKNGWDLDLELLKPLFEHECGIVPVAPFGTSPQIDRYANFEHVVHDAAASIASIDGMLKLKPKHAVVFSLHATKVLGSGEGSVVVFGSESYADEFRMWTNFGFKGSRESQISATNAKMSEIQAAYVHGALDNWQKEQDDWLSARGIVNEISKHLKFNTKFSESSSINPYWIVEFDSSEKRNLIQKNLNISGFETRLWWSEGCHKMPAFIKLPKTSSNMTDLISSSYLGLPMNRNLDNRFMESIIQILSHPIH
jgi:dTDP-4-amino-4,6-dideoxygalactose transaminase